MKRHLRLLNALLIVLVSLLAGWGCGTSADVGEGGSETADAGATTDGDSSTHDATATDTAGGSDTCGEEEFFCKDGDVWRRETCGSSQIWTACGIDKRCDQGECVPCQGQTEMVCQDGNVWERDTCGDFINESRDCLHGCEGGACVACESSSDRVCYDGDVYALDTCGERDGLVESCQHGCQDGQCATCQACDGRECGWSSVCGESCGQCTGFTECSDAGQCVTPSNWARYYIDGTKIGEKIGLNEAAYVSTDDRTEVFFQPIATAQIRVADASQTTSVSDNCSNWTSWTHLSVTMPDTHYLPQLPSEWSGQNYWRGSCSHVEDSGDSIQTWSWEVTSMSTSHATGSFEVVIDGQGPRAGQTLRIEGAFDTDLTTR